MTSFIVAFAMLAQTAQATWAWQSRGPCDTGVGHAIVAPIPVSPGPLAISSPPQTTTRRPPPDHWFAADKVRHFGVAFAVTGFAYAGLRAIDLDRDAALAGAGAAAVIAGLGKELYDRRTGRGFSMRDLVWDVAGTMVALALLDRAR